MPGCPHLAQRFGNIGAYRRILCARPRFQDSQGLCASDLTATGIGSLSDHWISIPKGRGNLGHALLIADVSDGGDRLLANGRNGIPCECAE